MLNDDNSIANKYSDKLKIQKTEENLIKDASSEFIDISNSQASELIGGSSGGGGGGIRWP